MKTPTPSGERLDTSTIRWCPHCSGDTDRSENLCGHEEARLIEAPREGTKFAKNYTFLSLLGVGGMGAVYKCINISLDRVVAVKTLVGRKFTDSQILRFQQEAKATGKFKHQNLVSVHDFGITNDGVPFMVMEYLEGLTLADALEREEIDLVELLDIFRQCCDGLAYAHRNGVLHRDLKPANIMLMIENEQTIVKILDFGIAKLLEIEQDQGLTKTGAFFGTPPYMSPEQTLGINVTEKSDVYSLGCVLYEALTGVRPFQGRNPIETFKQHQTETADSINSLNKNMHFPEALERLVGRVLEKEPEQRPSMDALRWDLEQIIHNLQEEEEEEHRKITRRTKTDAPPPPVTLILKVNKDQKDQQKQISISVILVSLAVIAIVVVITAFTQQATSNKVKTVSLKKIAKGFMEKDHVDKEVTDVITDAMVSKPMPSEAFNAKFQELKIAATAGQVHFVRLRGMTPANLHKLSSYPVLNVFMHSLYDLDDTGINEIVINYKSVNTAFLSVIPNVTEKSIVKLIEKPGMHGITLTKMAITPKMIEAIADSNLKYVNLALNQQIDDESLKILSRSTSIIEIAVNKTSVTDGGVRYLPAMSQLVMVNLNDTKLSDTGVATLCRLPRLKNLHIEDNVHVTDNSVINLAQNTHLDELYLANTSITPKSIPVFRRMNLKKLSLSTIDWDGVTEESVIQQLPNTLVHFGPTATD